MIYDPLAEFDAEIRELLEAKGIPSDLITIETPPNREFGERAVGLFRLAKERRQNPRSLAAEIAAGFQPGEARFISALEPAGAGFLNVRLNYAAFLPYTLDRIREAGAEWGTVDGGLHIIVEHTSVNPNKEWHIGHVRNAVLGDVIMRLLRRAGHEVEVQNYIDDTGLQAAEAVFALQAFPEPEEPGEKYDHYVGRLYVKVATELAAEKALRQRLTELNGRAAGRADGTVDERTSIEARLANIDRLKGQVLQVMRGLEAGEYAPIQARILDAQLHTAYRLGIYYSLLNWESNLVESGIFAEAIRRVQESPYVFTPAEGHYAGALVIQTGPGEPQEPDAKAEVLIRSNGIPTYVAKDIAYHMWKLHLLPDRLKYVEFAVQPNGRPLWSTALHGEAQDRPAPDRVINVIGVHQAQAQATVKDAIRAAGFAEAADKLYHLAYGMVSTAEGKISGRQGTAVSGDLVIEEAVRVALERVRERGQDVSEDEMVAIAEAVGVGAVRYFMAQYNPMRDIVFDVGNVVSYDGNTGLYVQYALVRMYAILRRARQAGIDDGEIASADTSILDHEQEKRLVFHLSQYPRLIADASRTLAANLVAEYAFDLATIFNQFYRDCGVLNADPPLRAARLRLVETTRDALVNACDVLGLPVIERL